MAFITQSVMSGFQQGQQLGQQEQQMKMLQEQQAQQQQAMEREQSRKQRLSGLLGAYARGEQVLPDIASMGPEGIEAVKGLQGVMPEPQDPVKMFERAYDVALSMPEEKRAEAFQGLIAAGVQNKFLTEEQGDQLSFATQKDPNSFIGFADRVFGRKKPEETALVRNIRAAGIDPESETGRQLITASLQGKSQRIEIDPKTGAVSITEGAAADQPLQKRVAAGLQESVIEQTEQLDRMEQQLDAFNPEWLRIPERAGLAFSALKEKFTDLPEGERETLEQFSDFKAQALGNLNAYIKAITGAAMTESEAKRITRSFPSVGEGIFDGDSPSEFSSKLSRVMKQLKTARARSMWALKNAESWEDISLDSMSDILKKEQARFYEEAGWNDDLSDVDKRRIYDEVKARLRSEYGI